MDSYIDKITKLEAENLELSNMYKQQIEKNYSLRVDKDCEISALKSKLKKVKGALEIASNYMNQQGQDATYLEVVISEIGGEI